MLKLSLLQVVAVRNINNKKCHVTRRSQRFSFSFFGNSIYGGLKSDLSEIDVMILRFEKDKRSGAFTILCCASLEFKIDNLHCVSQVTLISQTILCSKKQKQITQKTPTNSNKTESSRTYIQFSSDEIASSDHVSTKGTKHDHCVLGLCWLRP